MHLPRIYCDQPLASGKQVTLDDKASGHLLRVLRCKIGSKIKLFDGHGQEFWATITTANKNQAMVTMEEAIANTCESSLYIHLGQSISRADKMHYTLQKAVELGITQITPLFTENSALKSAKPFENRLSHWQKILISACEQAGRNYLPTLAPPQRLKDWLGLRKEEWRFILEPTSKISLTAFPVKNPTTIALIAGPEGGLTSTEISLAQEYAFQAIRLGPRILRTETAAPAAITAMQVLWGDMG